MGGVDLSLTMLLALPSVTSPRPCGLGGFKQPVLPEGDVLPVVPARVGGVDLSSHQSSIIRNGVVPARVRGVDLSMEGREVCKYHKCPRPCGRGGFKPHYVVQRRFQHCLCHLGCNFDTFSYAIFI